MSTTFLAVCLFLVAAFLTPGVLFLLVISANTRHPATRALFTVAGAIGVLIVTVVAAGGAELLR